MAGVWAAPSVRDAPVGPSADDARHESGTRSGRAPGVRSPFRPDIEGLRAVAIVARIKALHPAVVVTSSNADGGDPQGPSGSLDSKWTKAWGRTATALAQPGTRVVYLNDTPWPKENVPDCLAEHPRAVQTCAAATEHAAGSPRRSMMAQEVTRAGATVVDPMPWFCSLKTCPVVIGNILVYKDESHISTVYARLLAPILSERLQRAPK